MILKQKFNKTLQYNVTIQENFRNFALRKLK